MVNDPVFLRSNIVEIDLNEINRTKIMFLGQKILTTDQLKMKKREKRILPNYDQLDALANAGCARSTSGCEIRALLPKRHDNSRLLSLFVYLFGAIR